MSYQAMSALYRIAPALTQIPDISDKAQCDHTDFRAVSVTERSCEAPILVWSPMKSQRK